MKEIDTIISHYLIGEISDDETVILHAWLEESEDNRDHFRMMCDAWHLSNLQGDMTAFDSGDAFHTFIQNTSSTPQPKQRRFISFFKIAASILVLCTLTVFFLFFRKQISEKPVTLNAGLPLNSIVLPDSSLVWLKSGTISYNKRFGLKERSIVLNGEALFDVPHLHGKPFTVNTGSARIVVLGTRFNVLCEKSGDTRVFVKRGKVKVFSAANPSVYKIVNPNQVAVISKHDSISLITQNKELNKTAWFTRELFFANESLPNVLKSIEQNSSKRITVLNPDLLKEYFSGTILLDSTDSYFNILSTLYDIKIETKGDSIFLH